jgi:hypothetical protein
MRLLQRENQSLAVIKKPHFCLKVRLIVLACVDLTQAFPLYAGCGVAS